MQLPEYLMGALATPEDAARFSALIERLTTPGPCFAMWCGFSPRREGKSRIRPTPTDPRESHNGRRGTLAASQFSQEENKK